MKTVDNNAKPAPRRTNHRDFEEDLPVLATVILISQGLPSRRYHSYLILEAGKQNIRS